MPFDKYSRTLEGIHFKQLTQGNTSPHARIVTALCDRLRTERQAGERRQV
jgi:hypothetical protein